MQKHMLQLGVVLIVTLITTGIGARGPLASAWKGGRSRCPNRAYRLLATLVIVLCVSAVAQAGRRPARCLATPIPPSRRRSIDATCATINVAAGTYPEHVTIARDVTIRGDGTGQHRRRWRWLEGPVVTIASGTVTIRGVTIQNGGELSIHHWRRHQ